ncbi:MAG: hypothetical protein OXE80_00795, partial [Gammaproteobacteria bacterium]|nr:hypothetical protein [Gammaproteobacteria bacterium]
LRMDLRPNITKIGYAGEMDGFDPAVAAAGGCGGRCEYVLVRFGLDILSRTPAAPPCRGNG